MKRVAIVGGMIKGVGISQYIIDTYSRISADYEESIELTFVIESGINDYKQELSKIANNVVYITPWKENPVKYFTSWISFLSKNHKKLDIIHFHYDQLSKFWPFLLLKIYPIAHVIIHSHNSFNTDMEQRKFMKFSHQLGKKIVHHLKVIRFAVSDKAGKWLYDNDQCQIIHNGIQIQKFKYSNNARFKYRRDLGITSNEIAFVNVGRFKKQKNHRFLIELFEKVHHRLPQSKLFLLGEGPMQNEIKSLVKKKGLEDSVVFLGLRTDVNSMLSAFDLLLFPSFYEGFPIALVEAQANGLPIIYSDSITRKIELTDRITKARLNDLTEWEKLVFSYVEKNNNNFVNERVKAVEVVKDAGYDVDSQSKKMGQFYLELDNK